jgi:hypothetical protein
VSTRVLRPCTALHQLSWMTPTATKRQHSKCSGPQTQDTLHQHTLVLQALQHPLRQTHPAHEAHPCSSLLTLC